MKLQILYFLLFFSNFIFSQSYKKVYETTVSYQEGNNSGSYNFKLVLDVFFNEPLEKVAAELVNFQNCKPNTLDVTVDIFNAKNIKVSSKTFKNVIDFDVNASPNWNDFFPGLNEDQSKELFKNGFTIRNARISRINFAGCKNEPSNNYIKPGNSTITNNTSAPKKSIAQQHDDHVSKYNESVRLQREQEMKKQAEINKQRVIESSVNNTPQTYHQQQKTDHEKQIELFQQQYKQQQEQTKRIEAVVMQSSYNISQTISRMGNYQADIGFVRNSSSPEMALQNYKQELERIKRLQQQSFNQLNTRLTQISYQMQQSQSKEESTAKLISASVETLGYLAEQKKANDEKKRLEAEYRRKIDAFVSELIQKNSNGYHNSINYAIKEIDAKQESFFLNLSRYYLCNINYIKSNFSYNNTYWAEYSGCSYPINPNRSRGENNLTSDEYITVAKRKEDIYQNNKDQKFRTAALYYLNKGIEKNPKNPEAFFFRAQLHEEYIDKMIDINYAISLNPKNEIYKKEKERLQLIISSELFSAIQSRNIAYLEKAVANNLHHDIKDANGNTPLMAAIQYDSPNVFNVLLGSPKSKTELLKKNGQNYINLAAISNSVNMLQFFENEKISIHNIDSKTKESALYFAAINNAEKSIEYILRKEKNHKTTLETLVKNKKTAGVNNLVRVKLREILSRSDYASQENLKIAQELLNFAPQIYYDYYQNNSYFIAEVVKTNKHEYLNLFLKKGANPNIELKNNDRLLSEAIHYNAFDCIELLIHNGAETNYDVPNYGSVLNLAISKGYPKTSEYLLQFPMDINAQDKEKNTALNLAIDKQYYNIYTAIMNYPIPPDINKGNYRGIAPIHKAIFNNNNEILTELITKGADIEAIGGINRPLHWAAELGKFDAVVILVENKANVFAKNYQRKTAYTIARNNKHKDCAEYLKTVMRNENKYDIQLDFKEISCFNKSDGEIYLSIVGGTSPHSIEWKNITVESKDTLKNLSYGWYTVKVTDARNNIIEDSIFLENPKVLNIDFESKEESYFAMEDARIFAIVSGGKAPYQYQWLHGETKKNIYNLKPNTYSLTITDANLCSLQKAILITPSSTPKPVKTPLITKLFDVNNNKKNQKEKEIFADSLAKIHLSNADIYLENGDTNLFFIELQQAEAIDFNPSDIFLKYSEYYLSIKDFKNSDKFANKALKLEGYNYKIHQCLALIETHKKNYKKALNEYRIAFKIDSTGIDLHKNIADFYALRNNPNLQLYHYNYIIKNGLINNEIYLQKTGLLHFNLNNYPDAIENYTKYMELNNEDAYSLYLRGKAYMYNGENSLAENDIIQAKKDSLAIDYIQDLEKEATIWYEKGINKLKNNDTLLAIQTFDAATKFNPKYPQAWLKLGENKYYKQDYLMAVNDLDVANSLQDNYDTAFYFKALSYNKLNDYNNAIQNYTNCLNINPKYFNAWLNKATFHVNNNELLLAKQAFDQAINLQPKNASLYLQNAWVSYNLTLFQDAVNYGSKAQKFNKKNKENPFVIGKAHYALNNGKKAIKKYDEAIKLDKKYSEAYYEKAKALMLLNKPKDAFKICDKALKYSQHYADANLLKAQSAFAIRKYDIAIQQYILAYQINPALKNNTDIKNLGTAYLNLPKQGAKEAIEYFSQLENTNKNAEIYFLLAASYCKNKQQEEAITFIQKTVQLQEDYKKTIKKSAYFKNLKSDKTHKNTFKQLVK